jgi:hypothetical protein
MVALALLSSLALVFLQAKPASAAAPSWSSPSQIDPDSYLSSVSCPSASFCAAVEWTHGTQPSGGNVLTYNGSSWSSPSDIDPGNNLASVSCPSASFCVAVDDQGNFVTYNGSSWSSPSPVDQSDSDLALGLDSVSCPSASFCVAVSGENSAFVYNGSSWSSPSTIDLGESPESVSCPSASFCAAVGEGGYALTYNGSSWSSASQIELTDNLYSVSCPSASFCVAVDNLGNVITYNGSSWSSPSDIDAGGILDSVSCPSASFCVAVDGFDGYALTYNGSSWSSPSAVIDQTGSLHSVSCPSASFCAAVDNHGNALTYSGASSPTPPPPPTSACNPSDHAVYASAVAHAIPTTSLGFTALSSPVRIADTRSGATDPSTYAGDTVCPGGSLTIDIPSADVPSGAGAIVAQLTAVNPTAAGFLTVYPAGTSNPGTANVNFTAGQVVGNLVTVGLGTDAANGDEAVTIYNGSASDADFTLDLYGYYAPQSTGSGDPYLPLAPARIFDTRAGSGEPGAGETLSAGGSVAVPVTGVGGVPSSGVSAVVVNIAATNTTAASYLQGYPTGAPPSAATPTVNETWVGGETLSTKAIIGVGSGGSITLSNHAGDADVVIDVDGYFGDAGAPGALFNAIAPMRLLDTRPGGTAGGASATAQVTGSGGVPASAVAAVLDVVDIASGANFLTVYPSGQNPPLAADVNWVPGDTYDIVDNASYATVGSGGAVDIYNGPAGTPTANIVVDEFGYFASS